MIKTSKKIIAMLMAAILMVAMVPFTASAATEQVSFTVDCAKEGYTFTVYQVATLDTETGNFTTVATDTAIIDAVKSEAPTASVLAACDAATTASLGTVVDTYTSAATSAPKTLTVASGIYYIKATSMPTTVKSVTNSVVALPYYDSNNNTWVNTLGETINLAAKVNDGDVYVDKKIIGGDAATYTTAGVGDDVTFALTSTVVGSKEMKLNEYTIVDTMSSGLTFKEIDSVKLTGGSLAEKTLTTAEYRKTDGYQYDGRTYTFGITLANSIINSDDFYSYSDVVVTYKATLNQNAVIGNPGNPNSDALVYENANGEKTSVDGTEVKVYTFGINVLKVDSNDNSKKLAGAEFSAYDGGTVVAKAVTDGNGEATFMALNSQGGISTIPYRFDKGDYIVKETKSPAGYNLNSKEFTVSITPTFANSTLTSPTTGYVSLTVENTPVKLPETGGMGTMVFTLTGAALIACAGVLFVILKKKKSSK